MQDALPAPSSPFKLLDHYVEADADIFGGRSQEIFEITARLASRGILVLCGPSGIGKTSLIQAGVFPSVRRLNWQYVYVRTLTNPLIDLKVALEEQLRPSAKAATRTMSTSMAPVHGGRSETRSAVRPNTNSSQTVLDSVASYACDLPLLIVFDQFEEFFIRFKNSADLKTSFINVVADIAARNDLDSRILFSLREDYLANFDEFRRRLPNILENSYRVGPLSAFGARETITRPLLHKNIPFDNRLISDLLEHLAKYDFDPALLQIVCGELVRVARERDPRSLNVTSTDLNALGGIEGIFELYLDNAIEELPAQSRLVARLMLDAFTSRDRTKQAMRIEDLLAQPFVTCIKEVTTILTALHKFRLLRQDIRGPEEWFELVHERLVPIIQHWIRADPDYFSFIAARDLVEFASKAQVLRKNPEALLNRGQIEDVVGPYRDRLRFDHDKVEFLLLSSIYRDSSAVNYWAKRYGHERAMDLLLAAARSDRDAMRLGTMSAINRLDFAPSRNLLDACLDLSLNDPNELVRRAAGSALGHYGQEENFVALEHASRVDGTRNRALDVYADVLRTGRVLPGIGLFTSFKAKRIARNRRLYEHRDLLRQRANLGMIYGIAAGVAWSLSVSPLLLLISGLWVAPGDFLTAFAFGLAIVFPFSCALGALLGRTFAASAARRDVLGRREDWLLDMLFARVSWAILVIYIAASALAAVLNNDLLTRLYFVAIAIPLLYWIVTLATALAIGRECIGTPYRSFNILSWGSFGVLIVSAVLAVVCLYVGGLISDRRGILSSLFYVCWLPLTILGTTISIIALLALTFPRVRMPFQALSNVADGNSAISQ